ncbi:hypothetical protein [Kitasatospora sp. NPDC088783]|uniref:helix-turn-helix transcriptional regulator n=1 Tax=Kitasatospora sp. NPDC088783 TaxID=3364077 RepID=UPI0037F56895
MTSSQNTRASRPGPADGGTTRMPDPPDLSTDELAQLRFALLPDTTIARLETPGLPRSAGKTAAERACCLLGAANLVQAGALSAAYRLFTPAQLHINANQLPRTSNRRTQALAHAIAGLTAAQSATRMDVREETVIQYCRTARRRLGAKSPGQAGYAAVLAGWVPLSAIRPGFPDLTLAELEARHTPAPAGSSEDTPTGPPGSCPAPLPQEGPMTAAARQPHQAAATANESAS